MNSFYNTLCLASRVPEFAEQANGIVTFFVEGTVPSCTYENMLIALATAISINPAFAWWLLANGGVMASGMIVATIEFVVLNPTKMVVVYGITKKIPSLLKLYRALTGTAATDASAAR